MISKKRIYLFVCDDVEFWTPIIETTIKDYKICVPNSHFEICKTESIKEKTFSYFDNFYKIYALGDETQNKIKKSFGIDDSKIHLIKSNDNKRKLEDVLFDALVNDG